MTRERGNIAGREVTWEKTTLLVSDTLGQGSPLGVKVQTDAVQPNTYTHGTGRGCIWTSDMRLTELKTVINITYLIAMQTARRRLTTHMPVIPTRPEDNAPSDAPNLLLGSCVR